MPLAAFPKCFLDALCVKLSMTVEEWIDLAADQLDVDGLEFYAGFTPTGDAKRLAALRARSGDRGRPIAMMCYSPDFTKPDNAERAAEVESAQRVIDATAVLGARYCRVLSGQRRPGVSLAEGLTFAAEAIRELIPFAADRGIVLILENHYKDGYWVYPEFAQRADLFLRLLESIPESAYFGVNYDPSNAIVAGEDPIALLNAVRSRVVTMHASDRYFDGGTLEDLRQLEAHPSSGYASILRHGVIGDGLNDYDQIFGILKSVGFTGWISIEDGDDPVVGMQNLQQSASFLRAKMKEHGLP